MALAGLSTLGMTLSYGVETTKGTKPTTFTGLTRVNSIGGITITTNKIDASALEDEVSKYTKGRGDLDAEWSVTINLTDDTKTEWETLIAAYDALTGGKQMWFQVTHPQMEESFFIIAQPPSEIPMPELSQNELLTVAMSLVVNSYEGFGTKVTVS